MYLESFEIHNFRSIKHVKCQASPKITVLAGKNESGKTTILKALERFDSDFTEDDKSRTARGDEKPLVIGNFVLSKEDAKHVLVDMSLDESVDENMKITISTSTDNKLKFSGIFYDVLKKKIVEQAKGPINDFNNLIQEMKKDSESKKGGSVDLDSLKSLELETIEKNTNQLTSMQQQLTKNPNLWGNITTGSVLNVQVLLTELKEHTKKMDDLHEILESLIPHVILFDSFEDQLPAEIDLPEAVNALNDDKLNIVADFIKLSELDLDALQNPDRQKRAKVTSSATRISSDLFGKYWKQDPIDIEIHYDEPKLTFFVKDKGDDYPFKPAQRSKGIQWFMCFLARLKAHGASENNLILVDEPGLYLHAQAQQDVLNLLEEIAGDNNQIIFSTHSPYLIDPEKLNRIRLVIKDKVQKITQLENQFNKNADIETITPIITAIGLDISKGVAFAKKRNVIVEGVSDYYYILAMKKFLEQNNNYKFPEDTAIIPCVGESKVSSVASILTGYGLNYKIVIDEKGTRHTRKKLDAEGLSDKIITVGNKSNESIEDLFSTEDWTKYNSSEDNLSKTLTSKSFFENVEKGTYESFSTKTIQNFTKLLDSISSDNIAEQIFKE